MRIVTHLLIAVAFLAYVVLFGRNGFESLMFFAPFVMTPFAFTAYLVTRWHSVGSQLTLLVGTIGYMSWCVYLYLEVTSWHPDLQSPIAFLFTTIYAAPALLVLFWIAYALEWHHQARHLSDGEAI